MRAITAVVAVVHCLYLLHTAESCTAVYGCTYSCIIYLVTLLISGYSALLYTVICVRYQYVRYHVSSSVNDLMSGASR